MKSYLLEILEVTDGLVGFVRVLLLGRMKTPLWEIPLHRRLLAASNAIHECR